MNSPSPFATPYQTLYLIDISAFIFRAFYAVRDLTAPDGTPVNAVYGVASMLGKLLDETMPEYLAVVYDSKEPSFRKEMYPEYKANRSAPPEPLIPQFDLIEELITTMGIPSFRKSGVEADDLIATLRKKWLEQSPSHRVVVVTGDKDLMALVDSKTQVWDTMKGVHYTEHEVIEKFGVHPTQIRDYLAIVGDSSDNIPGITGVGPKGATQLLGEFQDLAGIIAAAKAGKVKGKKGENIVEGEQKAYLSRDLATLKEDIPLSVSVEDAGFHFEVTEAFLAFLKKYNFKQLFSKYSARHRTEIDFDAGANSTPVESASEPTANDEAPRYSPKFTTISTEKALDALIKTIEKTRLLAVDTETTSLNPNEAELVGIALAVSEDEGFYIPVGHAQTLLGGLDQKNTQLEKELVLEKLKPVLESSAILKIGQNIKYDIRVLAQQGILVKGIFADTMLAAYLLDSSGQHNLTYLSQKYLNYKPKSYEDVVGKGASQITFDQVSIEQATLYSGEDAWGTFVLWKRLEPLLKKQGFQKLFDEVDIPLIQVVADMEEAGIKIDRAFLQTLSIRFDQDLKRIEKEVQKHSQNQSLNLNSPKQLSVFLFDELKLPVQSKTKTGYSTDASVLKKLASLHAAPKLLLEYREVSKLKGTYVLPLQELPSKKDDRVRTSFHLAGTATGRLSSSDPNLQNIPTRTERGQLIRQAFIAEPGRLLLSADYSQIELRILAHLSSDPALMDSFQKDEDVHRRTASEIFHIKPDAVGDHERGVAKAINFGLMYGKSAFALAEELSISRKEAKSIIDRYFERYSKVKQFLDEQVLMAKEKGYVETVLGRKRLLPDAQSSNHLLRSSAERMAMNAPIQGTASDLLKIAMIQLHQALHDQKLKSKMLLQVHDELVLEVPEGELDKVTQLVQSTMENAMKLSVPLKVNVGVGKNWAEL